MKDKIVKISAIAGIMVGGFFVITIIIYFVGQFGNYLNDWRDTNLSSIKNDVEYNRNYSNQIRGDVTGCLVYHSFDKYNNVIASRGATYEEFKECMIEN